MHVHDHTLNNVQNEHRHRNEEYFDKTKIPTIINDIISITKKKNVILFLLSSLPPGQR